MAPPQIPVAGSPTTIGPTTDPTELASLAPTLESGEPAAVAPAQTPTPPPTPTREPAIRIEGPTRWESSASPILVEGDVLVAPGASLQIDPGVEVRFKPGTSLIVQGQVQAAGIADNPVRFVGPEGRWNGLVGQAGSTITLEHTEIRNAGGGGVALNSTGGQVALRNVLLTEGGGGIVANGAAVEMRNSQVTGNDLATGPALDIRMGGGAPLTLRENIIGGNQTPEGTPQVRLMAGSGGNGPFEIEGNAFVGSVGPLLEIQTPAALGGTIRCNGFRAGTVGLQLNSSTPSDEGFNLLVELNAFELQSLYGIASTIGLGAGNNWWGDPSGPADAQRNPEGRGVRAGVNVNFQPSLQTRPECVPAP